MRTADALFLRRVRKIVSELHRLDQDLRLNGNADAADVVKRARREFELADRQGVFDVHA